MAENIKYRFIDNIGDYFPTGYFGEDFLKNVVSKSGYSREEINGINKRFVKLKGSYNDYKNYIVNSNPRVKDAIKHTFDFHSELLKCLGYNPNNAYDRFYPINDDDPSVVPVRHILTDSKGRTQMLVMEMQHLIKIGDNEPKGLFEQQYTTVDEEGIASESTSTHQRYRASQWSEVFTLPEDEDMKISPAVINKAVEALFLLSPDVRPEYILMLAGNTIFLFYREKWQKGSYLSFSLDELFSQASQPAFKDYYALLYMLVSKDSLAAQGESVLMNELLEDSYKNSYQVTQDLKEGVVLSIETIANEALYFWKQNIDNQQLKYNPIRNIEYTNDDFEEEVKNDCLTLVYRLLFIFYAESLSELEILPIANDVYQKGYSLEMLRDLENIPLTSQSAREGYYIHESIVNLFHLLSSGFHESKQLGDKSFTVRRIDSPFFDDSKLTHLSHIKLRNQEWQKIIRALSLSKRKGQMGRISYANLGVNQLGSVYESLLAYRGFYAEEDYIEVHKAKSPEEGTFLVPYSRIDDFKENEILRDKEGDIKILPEGTFVYRLSGRDRTESASYYTPEVLTESTVKYTLKGIIDDVASGKRPASDLMELKILEPAMGAAAFQNEVINQIADAYLVYKQREKREKGCKNWRIAPDKYRDKLQEVKAVIAMNNVYGVDLNPTAIELGKLSLWLNVIYKDMPTPFFSNRLCVGNAVIGAWLKVYNRNDVVGTPNKNGKLRPNNWWEKALHKVEFYSTKVKRSKYDVYHFLLPDKEMLASSNIRDFKTKYPKECKTMRNRLKLWTAPISQEDFNYLMKLSDKIDILLKQYYDFQKNVAKQVEEEIHYYGNERYSTLLEKYSYEEKSRLNDERNRHDNAYFRLKMVMDYWCSLWFWSPEDAKDLPTREDYWHDIDAMLNVSDEELNLKTESDLKETVVEEDIAIQGSLFDDVKEHVQLTIPVINEEAKRSEIITKAKLDTLADVQNKANLFNDSYRFKVVQRYSKKYVFFHPMLEFIEVFWDRGGFDVICGNPPWIKMQFNEQSILAEKYPEVVIRKVSAPKVRKLKEDILTLNTYLEQLYSEELLNKECSKIFMNAASNYPLLVGQQTNLYKCVLENCMTLSSEKRGYVGILCPESIYDDGKGQPLRKELYKRLKYHFQYQNELRLFAEVHHCTKFGSQILGPNKSIKFESISNLYHPKTVDACFVSDGRGQCPGIKDKNGNWDVAGHSDRIVHYTERELKILAETFEGKETDWQSAKLISLHNKNIIDILEDISNFPRHLSNYDYKTTVFFNETGAVNNGIIKRETAYPKWEKYEMIYNGPSIFVANPLYKTPRNICKLNSDYDNINLNTIGEEYIQRTNYLPDEPIEDYVNEVKTVFDFSEKGEIPNHREINLIEEYKLAFRHMIGPMSEHTLIGAIIPPKTAHIHGIISVVFPKKENLVDLAALSSSLVLDFYVKVVGSSNLMPSRMESFPLGVSEPYKGAMRARILRLNCLTVHYEELWEELWVDEYSNETWTKEDSRLSSWSAMKKEWSWKTPLRNEYERRQALVEIDVLAAMALGLTLKQLILMYNMQFFVLQKYEEDTWYDKYGNIVFTCNAGLTGVGVDRPTWNKIKNMKEGETYEHVIETRKNELYGGEQITYFAPFDSCDRVQDYKIAWNYFETKFNK